ncbi:MAG: hypothetical protein IJN65_03795 [Clostridia bacterium]|nr:hypothetical protein [Clostridia bacterium]
MADNTLAEHSVIMNNRKALTLSGIKDVDSFSENEIHVQSVMGQICVRGSGLKIENFNATTLSLQICASDIYALVYVNDSAQKSGFLKRVFK